MALSLILRNSCKFPAILSSNVPLSVLRPTLAPVVGTKYFTQLTTRNNNVARRKDLSLAVVKPTLAASQRYMSADHSKLWPIEKALAFALVGIVPATMLFPNFIFDNLFAVAVVIHMHWGLEACCQDYVRPIILGPLIPKLAIITLYLVSALTLGSLLYYNYHDIGIGQTFQKFWAIKE